VVESPLLEDLKSRLKRLQDPKYALDKVRLAICYFQTTFHLAFPPPSPHIPLFRCLAPLFLPQGIVQAQNKNLELVQRLQKIQETASTNVEREERGAVVQKELDAKKRILLNLEKMRKDVGSRWQEAKEILEVEREKEREMGGEQQGSGRVEGKKKGKKGKAEWERHEKMRTQTGREGKRGKKEEEQTSQKGRENTRVGVNGR
jgi:hypothetical protein